MRPEVASPTTLRRPHRRLLPRHLDFAEDQCDTRLEVDLASLCIYGTGKEPKKENGFREWNDLLDPTNIPNLLMQAATSSQIEIRSRRSVSDR